LTRQNYITNLSEFERLSLREISARTGHHFTTVKKYVDLEDRNDWYKPRREQVSGPEPLKPIIDEWLLEDMKRAHKYRRTATKF
jgi:hypothetical protein